MLVIHHKPENAAAGTAAKTMKRLPARADRERRRLLLMKWAECLEVRSSSFQREIRTDHFDDIVRGGDLLDCFRRNRAHACLILFLPRLALEAMANLSSAAAFQGKEQ